MTTITTATGERDLTPDLAEPDRPRQRTRSAVDLARRLYGAPRRESQKPSIAFGAFAYAYASYRDDLGLPRPMMDGPNKSSAQPVDRATSRSSTGNWGGS